MERDQGTNFGKWEDEISQFMYHDSVIEILSKINIFGKVGDYGGGNGILKKFVPNLITIDSDESKKPDIVDNILTHKGEYDLIIIRYVLHYLNDYQVLDLFNTIKCPVLLIQFVNDDLKLKYQHREEELKYFRTQSQLEGLIPNGRLLYRKDYKVTEDFYRNRLGVKSSIPHGETLLAYLI